MSKLTADELAEKVLADDTSDIEIYRGDIYEIAEQLARAVLDKPTAPIAPAGELGEAMELVQKKIKECVEICNISLAESGCVQCKEILLARNLLALAAENKKMRALIRDDMIPLPYEVNDDATTELAIELAYAKAENGRLRDRIEIDLEPAVVFYQAENERLKKGGWTAVANGLPEKNNWYLVWHSEYDILMGWYEISTDGFQTGHNSNDYYTKVTHWRPLPDPPETKKKVTLAEARQKNSEYLKAVAKKREQAFIDSAEPPGSRAIERKADE